MKELRNSLAFTDQHNDSLNRFELADKVCLLVGSPGIELIVQILAAVNRKLTKLTLKTTPGNLAIKAQIAWGKINQFDQHSGRRRCPVSTLQHPHLNWPASFR